MLSQSMEIAFDSLLIRQICEDASHAVQNLGPEVADALMDRLADLDAATAVTDILLGRPRVIQNETDEVMAIDLCNGYTMVFATNHKNKPTDEDGRIVWDRVTRVKILQIQK